MDTAAKSAGPYVVKGTAVSGVINFIRKTFGEKAFAQWLSLLSPDARAIASQPISRSAWFAGALVMEIRLSLVNEFFGGDRRRLREVGKYTGKQNFTGVYNLAIKFGSPAWVIGRIGMVYEQMYRPGKISLPVREAKRVMIRLDGFPDYTGTMEHIFCGFLHAAVELSGAQNVSTKIVTSSTPDNEVSEVEVLWT